MGVGAAIRYDAMAALPQALQTMPDRRTEQARQAEQERAVRQQEIAADRKVLIATAGRS